MTTQANSSPANHFFGISLRLLGLLFFTRLTIDMGTRLMYPFIPQIAAGLGLSVAALGQLLALKNITGIASPLFGLLAERYGRRLIMTIGLLCQAVGVSGLLFIQGWWAAIPMLIFGLALTMFLPSQQGYISDNAAPHKRGRALSAVEFSWALTSILTLPLIGWLIDVYSWRAPFLVLGLLSFSNTIIIWFNLPKTEHRSSNDLSWAVVRTVSGKPQVLAAMGVAFCLFIAVNAYFSVLGLWFQTDFAFTAKMVGYLGILIGLAEMAGTGMSSLFIDRLGKKRGCAIGLLLTAAMFMLLPLTQTSLPAAMIILTLLALCLEFSVVSLLGVYADQAPEAPSAAFSLVVVGISISTALSVPLSITLWEQFGLWAVSLMSALALLICVTLLRFALD